jgi:hypothetical protein
MVIDEDGSWDTNQGEEKKNVLTGELLISNKLFWFDVKIEGSNYDYFANCTEEEGKLFLASEILISLLNLDALPKKVKDFDKEKFKADMAFFLKPLAQI